MPPDRGLATQSTHGVKKVKDRISIACTVNADGSDKYHLAFIGRYACPRSFNKKTPAKLGIEYHHNKTSWMTSEVFQSWIGQLDRRFQKENRQILLLLDNFSGHRVPENFLKNIRLEFFAPNLTSHVQPLDAGIINAFKAHYKKRFLNRAYRRSECTNTPLSQIYKIDILTAMRLAKFAWHSITAETIRNCWKHTGIIFQDDHVEL